MKNQIITITIFAVMLSSGVAIAATKTVNRKVAAVSCRQAICSHDFSKIDLDFDNVSSISGLVKAFCDGQTKSMGPLYDAAVAARLEMIKQIPTSYSQAQLDEKAHPERKQEIADKQSKRGLDVIITQEIISCGNLDVDQPY